MTETTTVLNAGECALDDDIDATLLDWLRERRGLTGTKRGCGEGRCGACTVLVDGRAVLSCLTPLGQVAGRAVTTIEGLAGDPHAEDAIALLAAEDGLQCGFCTPGLVVTLTSLARQTGTPLGRDQVRAGLAGNLCRCTGYRPIADAALRMNGPAAPPERVWGSAIVGEHYRRPTSLAEALEVRGDGHWVPVAGGTDLYVQHNGSAAGRRLLDLSGIAELAEISDTEAAVRIGATSTYRDLIASSLVDRWCAPLASAAALIGGGQVQNQGTIGGALAVASPTSDALPALAVVGADVELRSATATRVVAYRDFVRGPGNTPLRTDELVTAIIIAKHPAIEKTIALFRKAGARRAQSISIASVALRAEWDARQLADAAVCFGAVLGTAHVSTAASEILGAGVLDRARVVAATQAVDADTADRRLMEGLLLRACYDAGLLS